MKLKPGIFLSAIVLFSFSFISFHPQKFDLKASIERGKEVYVSYCITCHMEDGKGIEDQYPPLAKSDYMMADKTRSIQQVLYGAYGEMTVNGKTYNDDMKGSELNDDEASDLLNYIRNSWGNKGAAIMPADIKAARKPE